MCAASAADSARGSVLLDRSSVVFVVDESDAATSEEALKAWGPVEKHASPAETGTHASSLKTLAL